MTGYCVDNTSSPIKIKRPGETDPSFYVNTVEEAFKVIDLDIALSEEGGYASSISHPSPADLEPG